MEAAPLLKAHSHARKASLETQKANGAGAREEHELAASDFASAAKCTQDTEAVRILNLLEEHHQRLANIIQSQSVKTPLPSIGQNDPSPTSPTAIDSVAAPLATVQVVSATGAETSSPQPSIVAAAAAAAAAATGSRKQPRDLTSSIASNLANARGIHGTLRRGAPVSPTVSAQNARGRLLGQPVKEAPLGSPQNLQQPLANDEVSKGRTETSRTPKPSSDANVKGGAAPHPVPSAPSPATTDEPFQRFYSTFEGLLSKLSAPLAFAGLPIGTEEAHATDSSNLNPTTTGKPPHRTVKASSDPDVTKIFSKAALRAIKEDSGFGPAESFYVVPTTGGSARYADIASRLDHSALLRSTILEGGDEEFVDARETPHASSARPSRKYGTGSLYGISSIGAKNKGAVKGKEGKTMEELEQVNRDLKREIDQLAKTLYAWQTSGQEAQERSMALHASFRAVKPTSSVTLPSEVAGKGGAQADERCRTLEERLKAQQKEMERTVRENEKLKSVVGRYRERWDKLKEGARVRREGGGAGGTPPPS